MIVLADNVAETKLLNGGSGFFDFAYAKKKNMFTHDAAHILFIRKEFDEHFHAF